MCHWCDPDAEMPQFESKQDHDMWLYPHGRYGYTPSERVDAGIRACEWCLPISTRFTGLLDYLNNWQQRDHPAGGEPELPS